MQDEVTHREARSRFPDVYAGSVLVEGEHKPWPVEKVIKYLKLPPLMYRKDRWALTQDAIEFLGGFSYSIHRSAVHDEDWLKHLNEKSWFGVDSGEQASFMNVWTEAKRRWEKKSSK